jgi:uncharacterized phage-like protein YoqJ
MILAGTGHRPSKLGGYSFQAQYHLNAFALSQLSALRPSLVISGMAQGWDQALALAAVSLSIPFHAYVPCPGQQLLWPPAARSAYTNILARAARVHTISPSYTPSAMQARNIAMVNACTDLLALWDGSPGGTANCLAYARTATPSVTIHQAWPAWQSFTP